MPFCKSLVGLGVFGLLFFILVNSYFKKMLLYFVKTEMISVSYEIFQTLVSLIFHETVSVIDGLVYTDV